MRQRLGIARVLLGDPQLIILDEASNGLDPEGIFWLRHFILQLAEGHRTVVLASHLLHEVQAVSDTVVLLNGGIVIAQGATKAVTGEYATLEELYLSLLSSR
jgi:ABC-2 type transport system ATP-binding protein